MRLTNRYNLPETLVRATRKRDDHYDRGAVHRSTTQLISPPRIDVLRKANYAHLETDVADEFWSLLGSAVHHLLEVGATSDMIVEERLFWTLDGWKFSGAIDLQEFWTDEIGQKWVDISDYKVVSTYTIQKEEGEATKEWEQQQNIYRWLVEKNKPDIKVRSINIIVIIRDWQRAKTADPLYPIAPVMRIQVPMWSMEDTENYIRTRIAIHREAELLMDVGMELPECTDEERWERGSYWLVRKLGGKRATKKLSTEAEAEAFMSTLPDGEYEIVHKPGKSFRCEGNFCRVAPWCSQFQRMKNET